MEAKSENPRWVMREHEVVSLIKSILFLYIMHEFNIY